MISQFLDADMGDLFMDHTSVKIIGGAFADMEGEIVSVDGDKVLVRVSIFGMERLAEFRRDQLERLEDSAAVQQPADPDEVLVARLRDRVVKQYDDLVGLENFGFFLENAGRYEDLVAEWDAYVMHCDEVDRRVPELKATALDRFDKEIALLPADEATARIEGDPEYWLPADSIKERHRSRYLNHDGADAEARWSRFDQARDRRARARAAADMRDYTVWKASTRTPEQRAQARLDALAKVERERAAIEERFARDWGFELPDSFFRFWAFYQACGPVEQEALSELGLILVGITDLFVAPTLESRDGVDVRVHGRYYCDPPEFLTFMHGGTDGLHFGLWYDDGRTCNGVVSYYNNDGGGIDFSTGTPLEAVRHTLELRWRHCDEEGYLEDYDETRPYETELAEKRHRIRLLREFLMTFETGDRPGQGSAYADAHRDPREILDLIGPWTASAHLLTATPPSTAREPSSTRTCTRS